MNYGTEKYCKKGSHWVNRKLFYKKAITRDGLSNYCMGCQKKMELLSEIKKREGTIKAF
jgi:hypothetical protein